MTDERPMEYEMHDQLAEALQKGVSDETIAKIKEQFDDALTAAINDLEWSLKDDLANNLAWHVQDQFRRAFEAMLKGNEQEFRRYISADPRGFTGRDNGHISVIHHRLFESGPLELRRLLCDAYPDLLKNERILDLEAQVKALVEEMNKMEARNNDLVQRLNEYNR